METPPLSYSGDVCVRFAYHAYGNTIGRLRVSIKDTEDSLLEVASDRGNQWFTAELDATIASGDVVSSTKPPTLYHALYLFFI